MKPETIASIESRWRELRAYAGRLVDDLAADDMAHQPIPSVTMNHAAWALSHLSIYGPLLAGMLRNEPVEDPGSHKWGRSSAPIADAAAYPPKTELLRLYQDGYDDAVAALKSASDADFARPAPFERWRDRFPTVGHMPIHFLVQHNALHLGQISAWRRASGRPAV